MRKSFKGLAMIGVAVAALLLAPTAQASSHENDPPQPPQPGAAHTVCAVSGKVTVPAPEHPTDPPVQVVGQSSYTFQSAILECVGKHTGSFITTAGENASWGPIQPGFCDDSAVPGGTEPTEADDLGLCQGSATAASWSSDRLYPGTACDGGNTAYKGTITSNGSNGWVSFVRAATNVDAWGKFCDGSLAGESFNAQLLFTPTGTTTGAGEPIYDLNGTALIYT